LVARVTRIIAVSAKPTFAAFFLIIMDCFTSFLVNLSVSVAIMELIRINAATAEAVVMNLIVFARCSYCYYSP